MILRTDRRVFVFKMPLAERLPWERYCPGLSASIVIGDDKSRHGLALTTGRALLCRLPCSHSFIPPPLGGRAVQRRNPRQREVKQLAQDHTVS